MATVILQNKRQHQLIDSAILEDLAAEIVIDSHPGIEEREKKFHAFTRATVCLIQPPLEALAQAYLVACQTRAGGEAARRFLQNMLSAEA